MHGFIKSDSIDQALDILYTVEGTKLRKLSEEENARLKIVLKYSPS